jgi:hypothetical protein
MAVSCTVADAIVVRSFFSGGRAEEAGILVHIEGRCLRPLSQLCKQGRLSAIGRGSILVQEEFKAGLLQRLPFKIDIGAIYNLSVSVGRQAIVTSCAVARVKRNCDQICAGDQGAGVRYRYDRLRRHSDVLHRQELLALSSGSVHYRRGEDL